LRMLMAPAPTCTQPKEPTGAVSCRSGLPSTLTQLVAEVELSPLARAYMKKLPPLETLRSYHSTLPSSGTVVWLPLPSVTCMYLPPEAVASVTVTYGPLWRERASASMYELTLPSTA